MRWFSRIALALRKAERRAPRCVGRRGERRLITRNFTRLCRSRLARGLMPWRSGLILPRSPSMKIHSRVASQLKDRLHAENEGAEDPQCTSLRRRMSARLERDTALSAETGCRRRIFGALRSMSPTAAGQNKVGPRSPACRTRAAPRRGSPIRRLEERPCDLDEATLDKWLQSFRPRSRTRFASVTERCDRQNIIATQDLSAPASSARATRKRARETCVPCQIKIPDPAMHEETSWPPSRHSRHQLQLTNSRHRQGIARRDRHLGHWRVDVGPERITRSISTIRGLGTWHQYRRNTAAVYLRPLRGDVVGKAIAEGNCGRGSSSPPRRTEWEGRKVTRNAGRARILQIVILRRLRTTTLILPDPLADPL